MIKNKRETNASLDAFVEFINMSKLYQKYAKLKENNEDLIYLFLCGNFYIALDSDAIILNELFGMKLTKFSNLCDKCGFPKNSLEKYVNMFEEKNIKYRLIENDINDKNKLDKIYNMLKYINIENLSNEDLKDIILIIKNLIME